MSKIQIHALNHLDEDAFKTVCMIWELTKIGNPARGDSLQAINQSLEHGGLILIANMENQTIGTAWLTHDWRRLYIHHMAVIPQFQDQHVGKALLDASLSHAASIGLQAKLEVHKDNPCARHLYEAAGFEYLDGYMLMVKR